MNPAYLVPLWLLGASAAAPASDAPAAVLDSTPESRSDIQQAVSTALGRKVLIADNALTTSSLLIIERREPRTIDGRVGGGRILDSPETFELVLDDGRCVLVHRGSKATYPLGNTRCQPSRAAPRISP